MRPCRLHSRRLAALVAVAALVPVAGCSGELGASAVIPIVPAETLVARQELVYSGDIQAVVGLANERVLLQSEGQLLELVPGETPRYLGEAAGELLAAVSLPHTDLIAGSQGLYALRGDGLESSPLNDSNLGLVRQLHPSGDGQNGSVWLVSDDAVHTWSDGAVRSVSFSSNPEALATSAAHNKVFATQGARLLVFDEVQKTAVVHAREPLQSLGASSAGHAWSMSASTLMRVTAEGDQAVFQFPTPVLRVITHAQAPHVWVEAENQLWVVRGETFRPVAELPNSVLDVDPDGSALVAMDGSLFKIRPVEDIELVGPEMPVEVPTRVRVRMPSPGLVDWVDARIDGVTQWVDPTRWEVVVDPWVLPNETTTLDVTVHYFDGGAPLSASLPIVRGEPTVPTWSEVKVIMTEHCRGCHDSTSTTRPLHNRAQVQSDIAAVMESMRTGRMPLPPAPAVPGEDIAVVNGWRLNGFEP